MIRKFRHKLILALTLLIFAIIFPMVLVVNKTIDSLSESRIDENLKVSKNILDSFFKEKERSFDEAMTSLIKTQANIRAVLATSVEESDDDLFGDDDDDPLETEDSGSSSAKFEESHSLLASTVEDLPIYKQSGVFAIVGADGQLFFSKSHSEKFGTDLKVLPEIRAGLRGETVRSFWGSQDPKLELAHLVSSDEEEIYQIFIKPVSFDQTTKGLVIVGFAMNEEVVQQIQKISRSDIGFQLSHHTSLVSNDLEEVEDIMSSDKKSAGGIIRFFSEESEEDYIALQYQLENSLSAAVGTITLFRSKTKELMFYERIKAILIWAGAIAAFLAVFAALFLSGPVTEAIRSLIKGVKEVHDGNLDASVQVKSNDEFKTLADAFNEMTSGLREKEKIKSTFKRYVNHSVVESLLEDSDKLNLGGDRRDVAIFFSDVAGFTAISEQLTPEQVVSFLNEYLGEMTNIIESSGGIVDKYIGDAILAYWINTDRVDGRSLACEVALKQQQAVSRMRERWKDSPPLAQFGVRIGIHSGHVLMGNIGSESRMDYTIVGDDVNTAARLESVNKQYGTRIIVSENVQQKLKAGLSLRKLDSVFVVGKTQPVSIYELIIEGELEPEAVQSFEEALGLFQAGQFEEAKEKFLDYSLGEPDDKAAPLFISRCDELILYPPKDWDGVYKLNTK